MSKYIGVRCPVCTKKFSQADDIVVCPVCGAPHHRECYQDKGACAFVGDHLNGKEWLAPDVPEQGEPPAVRQCPRCSSPNPPEGIFCHICGARMSDAPSSARSHAPTHYEANGWGFPGFTADIDPIAMMYGGVDPNEEMDGESVRDLQVYIGQGSAYYLPRFKMISESNHSFLPNFAAFFFNFFFYFYRKMYLIGAILLALFVVSMVPAFLYAAEIFPEVLHQFGLGPAVETNTAVAQHFLTLGYYARIINFAIGLILSMCANRFYYDKAMNAVNSIRTGMGKPLDEKTYLTALTRAGGYNKTAVIIVAATIMAAYFIASMVMAYMAMGSMP